MSSTTTKPTAMLEAILRKGRVPFRSCFLGQLGSGHVVCYSHEGGRKVANMLKQAGFKIRGMMESAQVNKAEYGGMLAKTHTEYTVAFILR